MNKTLFWIAVAAVIVVAVVAGVVSYDHLHTVAVAAGEQNWIAKLVPLSADGLLVSASLSAFVAKWQGRKVHAMTKLSLAVGLTASIAANIASPFVGSLTGTSQDILAAIVGAWPAIALALSFEEVLRLSSMWKAEASNEVATEVAALPEVTAEVLPETVAVEVIAEPVVVPEVPETAATPEALPLPMATPPVRKSAIATAPKTGSVKAEALRYLADKPETTAAQLALRFDRSDRWARMIRKDFQEAQQSTQTRELVAV
ncbi:DUF2637 domain-containing protein [Lentzea sp. BCCO 10_0798]|uniref:DUF2637 domain-containing protein n=1 Tax=Lentzea kristufekii TaxID=3095430 RepID=A0ABU4THX8_9PSEU|nr:DUF2637 domain-containing protein [Lentzea sp. BCCO 10_0798]MDX8047858.1 DUF2637 domain-containing protein [Lentzea sp. BCCO 10_0798]